jgi:16S rRNA (cytidine1402-2'-O)-methyltransferase
VTHRALRVLREVAVVACEDTRVTRVLLDRYGIRAARVAYHERNRERAAPGILARLSRGDAVALVTDAGTPGISDPAAHLVALAVDRGVPVVPVPGPSALLAALVASGLPTVRFLFEGFLPKGGRARRERIARLAAEPRTIVLYEAAGRVAGTLAELAARLGARRAVVARELTKRHEEFVRGTLLDLAERAAVAPPRGEVVLVVEGAGRGEPALAAGEDAGSRCDDTALDAAVAHARRLAESGVRPTHAIGETARALGVPRRALYRRYLETLQEGSPPDG